MATAVWTGTGVSTLTLSNAQSAGSVLEGKNAQHEIFARAGDKVEVGLRKSEKILCKGVANTKTEFDNFRAQMKNLENCSDATFTYTSAGQAMYSSVAVTVDHAEIELPEGTVVYRARWLVEMTERV